MKTTNPDSEKNAKFPARQPSRTLCSISLLCALGMMGTGGTVQAQNDTWLGVTATNGTYNWSSTSNWSVNNGGTPTGVIEFANNGAATSSFDNLNLGGRAFIEILFDPGAPAYTISGSAFIITGSVVNNSSDVQTINDAITLSESVNNIFDYGTGNIYFGGLITTTPTGNQGNGWAFDAPLTTFAGGFTANTTTGRTLVLSGSGNILLSSPFGSTIANSGSMGLDYEGSGTLTFSAANGGSISGANATLGAPIQIATGGAPLSGTIGNSTLVINGNYTIGSSGIASLTIKGGNGTTTTRGTLSLEDGAINTLYINSTSAGATALTLGQSTAAPSVLDMDVGDNSADSIVLGNGLKVSVAGTAGVLVNLNGIGEISTSGTYTLLNAEATTLTAADFSLASTTGNFDGLTVGLEVTSGSLLQVTLTGNAVPPVPSASTLAATNVTYSGAILNGSVNPNGFDTQVYFQYGTTTSYGSTTATQDVGSGNSAGAVTANLSGLSAGTLYHYCLTAINSNGISFGSDQTFTTTAPPAPIATTGGAINVTSSGATLNGSVNPNGYDTTVYFQYGTTTNYGNTTATQDVGSGVGSGTSGVAANAFISELSASTLYHFRFIATNSNGSSSGSDQTFTTTQNPVKIVTSGGLTYTIFQPSNSNMSFATAVSGSNVVGWYSVTEQQKPYELVHGFLYNGTTFTTFDPTGSIWTFPTCVDGNNVAGYYWDSTNTTHGFLYNGTNFTTFDPPGSADTFVSGVSGNNVVGYFYDTQDDYGAGVNAHGFLYNSGVFTTFDPPESVNTSVTGVSGNNVVGYYVDSGNTDHGFLYNNGNIITLDFPTDSEITLVFGVSGNNVVGYYGNIYFEQGFLYNDGNYTAFSVPGTAGDIYHVNGVSGTNVVGSCWDSSGVNVIGFLYTGNTFITIVPPGSHPWPGTNGTQMTGVSGNNVVGNYRDGSETYWGFLLSATNPTTSLTVVANPNAGGTATGSGDYFVGTQVQISATVAPNWTFSGWSDGVTTNPRWVTVPAGGATYTANFSANPPTLAELANLERVMHFYERLKPASGR